MGLGMADFTTKALAESLNLSSLYANAMTSTFVEKGKIPIVMPTEREAIQAAVATCWRRENEPVRLAVIRSTLELDRFLISEPLVQELMDKKVDIKLKLSTPLTFNDQGELVDVL